MRPPGSIGGVATWDDLRVVLARLADQDPRPLTGWPDPAADHSSQPPFGIRLAAWATAAAEELRRQFGTEVELTVGALRYPQRILAHRAGRGSRAPMRQLGPAGMALDGPLCVRSGHTAHHGLLVSNLASRELQIETSGQLIADVVDLGTGAVVGGYSGPRFMMVKTFTVAPGATARIPLLVATDSFVPDLGYAVPAGEWGVHATLGIQFRRLGEADELRHPWGDPGVPEPRRARISPGQAGLPVYRGARRRVPGLRREEAAVLAGISASTTPGSSAATPPASPRASSTPSRKPCNSTTPSGRTCSTSSAPLARPARHAAGRPDSASGPRSNESWTR